MAASDDPSRGAEEAQRAARQVQSTVERAQRTAEQVQGTASAVRSGNPSTAVQSVAGQAERVAEVVAQLSPAGSAVQRAAEQARQVAAAARSVASAVTAVGAAAESMGLDALGGAAGAVAGLLPVEKVKFSFDLEEEPTAHWRVVELHAREGLSDLYTVTVDLANEDLSAEPDALLGASCAVLISRGAAARRLCGIAHRVEHLGTKAGHLLVRVHIVPALWALSQRRDSYIFQEKTVPQILKEVLAEGLRPYERTFRIEVQREYLPREYCVQYRETDLDFILRLMEEEGIAFYFDQSNEHEELVLFEANAQCAPCNTVHAGPVTIVGPEAGTAQDETLRSFEYVLQMHSTSVVIRDFDWTQPALDLTRKARGKDARGFDREVYEYPAPLVGPYDSEGKRHKLEQAQKQEELRRQALQVEGKRGRGRGNITGFAPGYTFELTGHGRSALDQKYLLTRVEHFGHAPEELTSDTHERAKEGGDRERYYNTFECIPLDVPFRPERRRSRARIHGLQTATVVGPPTTDEIFTDEHGRIKVQFHWDREGQRNERSSCFLRVAQAWAGLGWGFLFLPRIGMEVLVDFLEGDPDRPLVVGCVYNGQNPPPYTLPEYRTRSTLRTSSTPGGEGFNELRFEDAAGKEEVFLHAQKDLNEVVLHDHTTKVTANQTNTVEGSQTESVGGDQSMTVTGNRTKTIKQNEDVAITQNRTVKIDGFEETKIKGTRTETVTRQETLTLQGGREATVTSFDKLTINGERVTTITKTDKLDVTGDQTVKLLANAALEVTSKYVVKANSSTLTFDGGTVDLSGGDTIALHNGKGDITVSSGTGKVAVTAATEVSITCGKASLSLKSDGTVTINGGQSVGLGSGSTAVKLEPAGLTSSGPKITSSAIGIQQLSGALIKIN